jgi:hypothetical protein
MSEDNKVVGLNSGVSLDLGSAMKNPNPEIPEVDPDEFAQMRSAELIQMYLNQMNVTDADNAVWALSQLILVAGQAIGANSSFLTVQRVLIDIKKALAEAPKPGQVVKGKSPIITE